VTAGERGHGQKRERLEDRALAALLSESTIATAAEKAGVGESTLLRWLAEPAFKTRFRAARRSVVEGAIGRLQQAATQAVDALTRNLTCGVPAVEVGAARSILDQAVRAVELIDLAERVEALERTVAEAAEGENHDTTRGTGGSPGMHAPHRGRPGRA
jgi:hypothetical protein